MCVCLWLSMYVCSRESERERERARMSVYLQIKIICFSRDIGAHDWTHLLIYNTHYLFCYFHGCFGMCKFYITPNIQHRQYKRNQVSSMNAIPVTVCHKYVGPFRCIRITSHRIGNNIHTYLNIYFFCHLDFGWMRECVRNSYHIHNLTRSMCG